MRQVKRLSLRERYSALWLDKMRRSVHFKEIVVRLRNGETVAGVARWLMTQERGEMNDAGFETLRKYVRVLAERVRECRDEASHIRRIGELKQQAVEEVIHNHDLEIVTHPGEELSLDRASAERQVEELVEGLDSREMLRLAFAAQKARMERIITIEKNLKVPYIPDGSKNMDSIVKIAEAMRKWEVSEAMLHASCELGEAPKLLRFRY